MLTILDLNDIRMSGEAKAKRLMKEIEQRYNRPLFDTALTEMLAKNVEPIDPDGARKIIRAMGGEDGEG